jgi:hypothetical protein
LSSRISILAQAVMQDTDRISNLRSAYDNTVKYHFSDFVDAGTFFEQLKALSPSNYGDAVDILLPSLRKVVLYNQAQGPDVRGSNGLDMSGVDHAGNRLPCSISAPHARKLAVPEQRSLHLRRVVYDCESHRWPMVPSKHIGAARVQPRYGGRAGEVPLSGPAEVAEAVAAAAAAYPEWARTPVMERTRLMFRYKALLEEHFEELAAIVTRHHGKTLDEARGEVRPARH